MNKQFLKTEDELFNNLITMTNCHFRNCLSSSQPSDKFYSPFILALIGIFINQIKQRKFETFLEAIEKKLNETPNMDGIYNFFGDLNYFYDVDTTSVVNTFFILKQCKPSSYHLKIINTLSENRDIEGNAIQTWLNKPNNNVDWFVNYNFYLYTHVFNKSDSLVKEYLLNEHECFLKDGSRYYSNICFPSFFTEFNKREFKLLLPFKSHNISYDNNSLFHIGLSILNNNITELNSDSLKQFVCSNQVYFNSSESFYFSQELNAAIIIYLINKINNHEQQK